MGDQQDFIAAMRHLVTRPDVLGRDLVWVGGRSSPHGVVVLYRQRADLPVLGYRLDLAAHAALFDAGLTMTELAQIVYTDDLCSPAGPGTAKDVDWAEGLVEDPAQVRWVYGS